MHIKFFNYSFHHRERREAEQRERQEKERRERIERDRMERERREREREQQQKLSAVEAVDHHFQLSMELAKKVNKMKNIKEIFYYFLEIGSLYFISRVFWPGLVMGGKFVKLISIRFSQFF